MSSNKEQDDPYLGTTLKDRYELRDKIGEGGMGNVYAGVQQPLERDVAVKLLKPDQTDEEGEHYFMREVQAINMLRHPNIINIVDFGKEDNLLYLVMEYVPGDTLQDVIEDESPLEPERICNIMIQVLSALEQAHQTDIVHCDLKPANIMLEEVAGQRDFVKVLDFGISKVKGGNDEPGPYTQAGNLVGTFHYMSPEQVMREELNGQTDIWAVGVIIFEMLTQERIFDEADAVSIIGQVMQMEIPSPSDKVDGVPEPLEEVTMKALKRDKDERYGSADEMREDLKSALKQIEGGSPESIRSAETAPPSPPETGGDVPDTSVSQQVEPNRLSPDGAGSMFDEVLDSDLLNENLLGEKQQATVMAIKQRSRGESSIDTDELSRRSKKEAQLIRELVEQFGGRIDSFLGGMFVIVFGGDEERNAHGKAIDCALKLQSNFHSMPQGASHLGISLAWGDIHFSKTDEGNAYGDVVDRAVQLADGSTNAEVLVDQALNERVKGLRTKDGRKIQDAAAFPVRSHKGALDAGDEPESTAVEDIYVPRPTQYDKLSSLLSKTKSSGGRGVLLTGQQGVGKTTFLRQFFLEQEQTDCSIFKVEEPPPGRLAPVCLWMKQIANTYSDPETLLEKAADSLGIKKDANELASLYLHPFSESEDANPPPIEPSEFRHLTSGLLDRLLRFALKRGPVILSCDPLPEDTELNTFMNNLLKRLDSYRVLVIGTRQQTPKRLGQTNLEDFEQINLETLDRDQTGIFCQQILGHPPSEELKTLVQSISGGNPVFLKELVRNRSLSELELNSDTLESDSTSLRLRELLEKKLRNLSKKQIQLLKLISCLGETPRKQWAVSVAPSKLDAEETVEQIIDMGYLRETAVTDEIKTLSFSPATLHTVVYEKLPNERRKKIHGYVINFLKENAHLTELRPVDVPAAMAYHLQQVNQFDKAAAQRLKAGKMHISHCDYNHAIEQLEQGLEMANIENLPENHKLRVSLNVKLLTAFRESGQIDRAKEILDGLPNLGKIPGSFREKVLHETGLVELEAGSLQTSQNAFRKLGKIASRNDDIKLEIKSLLGRAEICEKTNDVGEAAELLQNMASKVENVQNLNLDDPDDRKLFWTAYNQLGVILIRQKDYESAKKFLNTALKRARSIDDKRGLIRVLCNLGALCMKVRKMEQAEDYFEKALSFARDIGDLLNQTRILTNLGISNMNLNRYENSKKYFAKAKKLAEQIGWYEGLAELSVHIKKLKKNLSPKTS